MTLFQNNSRQSSSEKGITAILDSGVPYRLFSDYIESNHSLITTIKFGWGTSIANIELVKKKVSLLQEYQLDFHLGGTLFEKSVLEGEFNEFLSFCDVLQCPIVEVSNGTIDISNSEKAQYIELAKKHFRVYSEVGFKDVQRSLELNPKRWIECIHEDLNAGAEKVITEARESGKSGVCRENGELRYGLISEILESGIEPKELVFEAPNKALQTYFIKLIGKNVNLANINFTDIIPLETLRQGLRSDTLLMERS